MEQVKQREHILSPSFLHARPQNMEYNPEYEKGNHDNGMIGRIAILLRSRHDNGIRERRGIGSPRYGFIHAYGFIHRADNKGSHGQNVCNDQ